VFCPICGASVNHINSENAVGCLLDNERCTNPECQKKFEVKTFQEGVMISYNDQDEEHNDQNN